MHEEKTRHVARDRGQKSSHICVHTIIRWKEVMDAFIDRKRE